MGRIAGAVGKETASRAREAALGLFARHGYAAVSMREIAGEVGVGAGALYNHFATKQDLLVELMTGHMQALLEAWAETHDPDSAPETRLDAFTRFHIRFHADRVDEVFVAYMELRSLEQPNFHCIEKMRRSYEAELETILTDGAASGAFRIEDARVAAMAIIAMLTGVTTWYRQGGRLSVSRVEEIYVDMVARSVRP
ncbi:MAG: TetR/AcrR family transcriptional regulator [Paracoccaceae bacterium]|nr:TetR/AcrR family transcriptional regulator [Paracoccaceae bacterium]